ncbi:hypothetical protein LX36DRAFT_34043 [Colletotrichum falcatum]|nr:hypothetical protein LX36DRAFT_34043 [Colletotrichum falcatum]
MVMLIGAKPVYSTLDRLSLPTVHHSLASGKPSIWHPQTATVYPRITLVLHPHTLQSLLAPASSPPCWGSLSGLGCPHGIRWLRLHQAGWCTGASVLCCTLFQLVPRSSQLVQKYAVPSHHPPLICPIGGTRMVGHVPGSTPCSPHMLPFSLSLSLSLSLSHSNSLVIIAPALPWHV